MGLFLVLNSETDNTSAHLLLFSFIPSCWWYQDSRKNEHGTQDKSAGCWPPPQSEPLSNKGKKETSLIPGRSSWPETMPDRTQLQPGKRGAWKPCFFFTVMEDNHVSNESENSAPWQGWIWILAAPIPSCGNDKLPPLSLSLDFITYATGTIIFLRGLF